MKKRALSIVAAAVLFSVTACSGNSSSTGGSASAPTDPAKVSGDITVLTNRTDLVSDGTLKKYAAQFNQIYPNVHVTFQGITDYEGEVKIRMNTLELRRRAADPERVAERRTTRSSSRRWAPSADLDAKYRFVDNGTVNGQVYGIAQNGNANGFVYNKTVWTAGRHHRLADDAGRVHHRPAGDQGEDDSDAVLHQLPRRLAADELGERGRLGHLRPEGHRQPGHATPHRGRPARTSTTIDSLLYNVVHDKLTEADPDDDELGELEDADRHRQDRHDVARLLGRVADAGRGDDRRRQTPADIGFMPWPAQVSGQVLLRRRPRLPAGRQHPLGAQGRRPGVARLVHRQVDLRAGPGRRADAQERAAADDAQAVPGRRACSSSS